MRQAVALVVVLLALVAPTGASANHPSPNCNKTYSYKHLKSAARSVYRHGVTVTRKERQKLRHFRMCARSHQVARRMVKKQRAWMRWRGSYSGYWRLQAEQLSAGTLAGLANLRGCETKGSFYPANYRYAGYFHGAYQYLRSTWSRAQSYRGTPARYRTGLAYAEVDGPRALKDHQDVVTAAYYPGHESEWPNCSM